MRINGRDAFSSGLGQPNLHAATVAAERLADNLPLARKAAHNRRHARGRNVYGAADFTRLRLSAGLTQVVQHLFFALIDGLGVVLSGCLIDFPQILENLHDLLVCLQRFPSFC